MEKLEDFIKKFFEAEKQIVTNYLLPSLENYNESVDSISVFVVDKLKNSFGAKLSVLMDESFYERMKKHPEVEPRFLFRIDQYQTVSKQNIFVCYVSNKNPKGWKCYFDCLIIQQENEEFKIHSKFNFSDRGLGTKKWFFNGGEEDFMNLYDSKRLMNIEALGNRVGINRFLEPSDDKDSMNEYNKE